MIQLALEGQHGRAEATEHGTAHAPAAAEPAKGSTERSRSGRCRRGQDPMLVPGPYAGPGPLGHAEMMGAAGEPRSGKRRPGLVCAQAAGPVGQRLGAALS